MQKQRSSKFMALGLIALVIATPLAAAVAAFALSNWHAGVFGGAFAVAGLTTGFLMRLPRVQAALRRLLPQPVE
ncbi:hypothetical protein [Brevundimonas sp.]|uniref:hypothetical protein n=1 Tax=Brevundimonas sp. TaxID=1871086 RepID=UPI0028AD474A|nr:hypothetical protein [Brevundimonas sp.]